MGKIRVVVDSSADFPAPSVVDRYGITVVPNRIHFGSESYVDGTDMDADAFFKRASREDVYPQISPPTVEQYTEVFTRLARETDKIVSLHTSRTINSSWQNAKAATQTLLGRCQIEVIDSQTTSAGLGLLTEITAKIIEKTPSLDEVVRQIRGTITRIYSIFYVDTLDYIKHGALIGEAQAVLGTMLGIKPFLTIEDGHLITMEKARTRSQAVDKLVEFVLEFGAVDQVIILQNSPFITESVRMLQDRLSAELGKRDYITILYGPTLGASLGLDATGVVVLESEEQPDYDPVDDFPLKDDDL